MSQNSSFPHGETFLGSSFPILLPFRGGKGSSPLPRGLLRGFSGHGHSGVRTHDGATGSWGQAAAGSLVLATPIQGSAGLCVTQGKPGPRERESPPKPEAFPSSRLQRPPGLSRSPGRASFAPQEAPLFHASCSSHGPRGAHGTCRHRGAALGVPGVAQGGPDPVVAPHSLGILVPARWHSSVHSAPRIPSMEHQGVA